MWASQDYAGNSAVADWFVPDTVQKQQLGLTIAAIDGYWGQGEFIYLKSNAAVLKGSLVIWNETYNAVLLPSTAGQGFPFAVAMNNAAAGTFFWAQLRGRCVYKTGATVAADAAIGIGAAGIASTNSAGKQLLGVRNVVAATGTVTVTAGTKVGNGILTTNGYDGFFLGMTLSGTGIPATTLVAALSSDGNTIFTGSAIGTLGDRNSTATGTITLTGTYTGYGSGIIANSFAQGAIT